MSNKSEPHQKFVQTFVLAEQPNGYFVLNDIFRYLKDEEDEIVDDEQPQEETPAEEPPTPVEGAAAVESPVEDTVTTESAVEEVDEKLEEHQEDAVAASSTEVNGALVPSAEEQTTPADETTQGSEVLAEEQPASAVVPEQKSEEPAPAVAPTEASAPPAADAPPAKKTWASMLGGGAKVPAVPALPATSSSTSAKSVRPSPSAQTPKPTSDTPSAAATTTTTATSAPTAQSNGWQTADHGKKGKPQNKATENIVLAYIKNVTEKVDADALRTILERYGELKYFDVSKPRVSHFNP